MSVLDDFVKYGTVELSRESGVTKAVFTGKPFVSTVPARLVAVRGNVDDALEVLWNDLVDAINANYDKGLRKR